MRQPIAYFSAEYAFDDLPIFAGGLGVLAIDYLKEAAERNTPYVAVGLFYHHGFSPSDGSDPPDLDVAAAGWQIVRRGGGPLVLSICLESKPVYFQAWTKRLGSVNMYLLDANVAQNSETDRQLTAYLYDKDFLVKFKQNALLGFGGVSLLEALNISPQLIHLNEGHTAFVTIARMAMHKRQKPHATFAELCEAVTHETVASKHTVLSAAGIYISHQDFEAVLGRCFKQFGLNLEEVFAIAQDSLRRDDFSTTRLMLKMARAINVVSKSHQAYEKKLHPGSEFDFISITNGINLNHWQDATIAQARNDRELWQAHSLLRRRLVDFVNRRTGSQLQPDILTVVWARRITAYKRPLELFSDLDYLERLVTDSSRPVQVIIAGRPNAEDDVGLEIAREIGQHSLNERFQSRVVYLTDYDLETARLLTTGSDIWLNTPEKGYEASGTSGMKAGSNGVLQCSVSDGWVDEVDLSDNSWILPEINTADAIYGYLENKIAPLYYNRDETQFPAGWAKRMGLLKKLIEKQFTTARMFDEYGRHLYKITPYQP